MDGMNDKYSRITFGFLLLSLLSCFPPMSIYLIYKMVRNTNIDYLDNYLSIKKCAKCFVWIPAVFTILCVIAYGMKEIVIYLDVIIFFWCFYGVFAFIFFKRAKKMKLYNEGLDELYNQKLTYDNPVKAYNTKEEYTYEEEADTQYKVAICNSCGAKKQIVIGRKEKCDYCDSPLEA